MDLRILCLLRVETGHVDLRLSGNPAAPVATVSSSSVYPRLVAIRRLELTLIGPALEPDEVVEQQLANQIAGHEVSERVSIARGDRPIGGGVDVPAH